VVTRVGTATGTTSCSVPAHSVGDYIVVFAFNDGSTTIPTVPSGYSSLASLAGTTCAMVVGFKVATATNDTSGTWTNATELACAVYTAAAGKQLLIGGGVTGNDTASGTTNTVNFAQLFTFNGDGTSWVAAAIGHSNTTTSIATAPTGLTNQTSFNGTSGEIALHDSNGTKTSWGSTNETITGTASGWVSITIEVAERSLAGWDPCNLGRGLTPSLFTVSGTNDVTCVAANTSPHDQTAVSGASSGSNYFEVTLNGSTNWNATVDPGVGVEGASGANACGWAPDGTITSNAGGTLLSGFTFPSNTQTIGVAFTATEIWFRNASTGGNWNNSGTANPATGTGGLSLTTGTYYPAVLGGSGATGYGGTLNTGTSSFVGALPSGFTALYSGGITTAVLAARSIAAATSRVAFKAAASIGARSMSASIGAAGISAKTSLSAKTTSAAKSSAGFSVKALLAAKSTSASTGQVAISSKVSLAARSMSATFGKLGGVQRFNLAAQSISAAFGRAAIAAKTTIAARGLSAATSKAGAVGLAKLSATSVAVATSKTSIVGKISLAARSQAAAFGQLSASMHNVANQVTLAARSIVVSFSRSVIKAFTSSPRVVVARFVNRTVTAPFRSRTVVAPAKENTVQAPPPT
jgi:hypothetical protein